MSSDMTIDRTRRSGLILKLLLFDLYKNSIENYKSFFKKDRFYLIFTFSEIRISKLKRFSKTRDQNRRADSRDFWNGALFDEEKYLTGIMNERLTIRIKRTEIRMKINKN